MPMKEHEPQDPLNEQHLLARLLREGRRKQGLTQSEAARQIGITPPYLNRLEAGIYSKPAPRILYNAARVYRGTTLADLFTAANYPSPSELPTLPAYLHATCTDLPASAIDEMVHYCEYIQGRYKEKYSGQGGDLKDEKM